MGLANEDGWHHLKPFKFTLKSLQGELGSQGRGPVFKKRLSDFLTFMKLVAEIDKNPVHYTKLVVF